MFGDHFPVVIMQTKTTIYFLFADKYTKEWSAILPCMLHYLQSTYCIIQMKAID